MPENINKETKDTEVTISKSRLDYLLERDNWLSCLEAAGVDNWIGYDDAREIKNGEA